MIPLEFSVHLVACACCVFFYYDLVNNVYFTPTMKIFNHS